jgi:hypothetical protein
MIHTNISHKSKTIFGACAGLMLAACSTAANTEGATGAKPDPRQGAEVRQICFSQQIRNWRTVKEDRRAVIVEKGIKDEYKLDLIGACQPQDAFLSIGLISRVGSGSCLSQGDRLVTDARYNDGDCSISKIYEWHKDAAGPDKAGAPAN